MNDNQPVVYAGVDTHQDVHVAVVVDTTGGQLACRSFPTSPLGLARLEHWLAGHGRVARVGVEGTGSYGLGLQRVLTRAGHAVVEVNRPNRQLRRARGKSDPVDALAAAQAAMPGQASGIPKSHDGPVEAIRVLRAAARSTREQMTRLESQIHHLAVTAPDAIRADLLPPLQPAARDPRGRLPPVPRRCRPGHRHKNRAANPGPAMAAPERRPPRPDRAPAPADHHRQPGPAGPARGRPRRRCRTAGRRRGQPRQDPLLSSVRRALRGQPDRRIQRQDQRTPAQPRREPRRERRPAPNPAGPHVTPAPSNHGLPGPAHHRRQIQTRRHALPETPPRPRDLPNAAASRTGHHR